MSLTRFQFRLATAVLVTLVTLSDGGVIFLQQPGKGQTTPAYPWSNQSLHSQNQPHHHHQQPAPGGMTSGARAPASVAVNQNFRCAVSLPRGCSCAKNEGHLSINCSSVHLFSVPRQWIESGPAVFRTLNLERNNIHEINDGDFFGVKIERLLLANNSISDLKFLSFWGLESSLETLDLSYNRFRKVPSEALRLLRNLRSLSLTGNDITVLNDFDFGYMRKLEVLALDKNPISVISRHALVGTQLLLLILDSIRLSDQLNDLTTDDMKNVKGLSLCQNKLRSLPPGWFQNLKSLRYLNLCNNLLSTMSGEAFTGLEESLQTLEIHHNHLVHVPGVALHRLVSLERLDLSYNRIRRIHRRAFNSSLALQSLDLSHNRIHKLSKRAFAGLDAIQKIDLRFNRLITIDDRIFHWSSPKGRQVFLSDNPWLCNCIIKWVKDEMTRNTEMSTVFSDEMVCERPQFLHGMALVDVPEQDFSCDHDYYYYYEETDPDEDPESETEHEGEPDHEGEPEAETDDAHPDEVHPDKADTDVNGEEEEEEIETVDNDESYDVEDDDVSYVDHNHDDKNTDKNSRINKNKDNTVSRAVKI